MSETTKEIKETVTPKAVREIIRGRMPVVIAFLIRFDHALESVKDLSLQFGTTSGKIGDIKAGSNFTYVKESFRPTRAQKDEAIQWVRRHPQYDAYGDKIVEEIEAVPEATAEEAAAFAALSRKAPTVTTKAGEIADGGGGNRVKPKTKTEKPEKPEKQDTPADVSAEDLLA